MPVMYKGGHCDGRTHAMQITHIQYIHAYNYMQYVHFAPYMNDL